MNGESCSFPKFQCLALTPSLESLIFLQTCSTPQLLLPFHYVQPHPFPEFQLKHFSLSSSKHWKSNVWPTNFLLFLPKPSLPSAFSSLCFWSSRLWFFVSFLCFLPPYDVIARSCCLSLLKFSPNSPGYSLSLRSHLSPVPTHRSSVSLLLMLLLQSSQM